MREYLDFYSNKFNNSNYNDWHIDDFFWHIHDDKYTDDSIDILKKYYNCISGYKKIILSDEEAEVLVNVYNKMDNVLVRSALDFLISTNKKYYKSSLLVEDCIEFLNLYIDNISTKEGGLASHNLSVILRWTCYKFPQSKSKINEVLFKFIMSGTRDNTNYFALSDYLLRDSELVSLLSKEQYLSILEKYFINILKEKEIYFYSDVYKDYLKYLKMINDTKNYKELLKKYCDFILINLKKFDNHFKQIELQIVRNEMDFLKCYSDADYLILDSELDKANKEQLSKMKEYTIELPKEQQKMMNDQIDKITNEFKKLNNADKIEHLLFLAQPISLAELQKHYENSKKGLAGLFTNNIIDYDGRIINYKQLKDSEDFSLKAGSIIKIFLGINFDVLYNPFFRTYVSDNNSEKYIFDIFKDNLLVDDERVTYLSELFISFLKQDFKNSSYDIVQELEESLRYYFVNYQFI